MKRNFIQTVTLHHFLPGGSFKLQTDASELGISGILYQMDDAGDARMVSVVSRVLSKFERQYTVTEKELLAIIYSLLKFRRFLLGSKFDIVTDHKALTFLLNTPYHNARLTRWILFAQEYDFNITHCRGSDNVVANFFSRNFESEVDDEKSNYFFVRIMGKIISESPLKNSSAVKMITKLCMRSEILEELKTLPEMQARDERIQCLKNKASSFLDFRTEDDVLYCKSPADEQWKIVLPGGYAQALLASIHEQLGHAGSFKMH